MKNFKIRNPFSLFILLFLVILVFLFVYFVNEEISSLYLIATVSQPLILKEKPITLMFVGDIMLDRGVEWTIQKYGQGDWKFPFLKIANYLNEADILFGNLEGPISDKGVKVGSIYSFRNNPKVIEGLTYAGFNILSVSNNHVFDYGRVAMEDTFQRFKKAGIDYVGGGFSENEAYFPVIREIRGIKIAFLAYTNLGLEYWSAKGSRSGIAWLDENIAENIQAAKRRTDLVIVSMHFGEEYRIHPTLEQRHFAHLAIDSGADLVIGHHPHIIQPIKKYKSGYIAYSLGNFVFDQGFSEETMKGLLLKVIIQDGKIEEVIPIKIKINKFFQPEIAKKTE